MMERDKPATPGRYIRPVDLDNRATPQLRFIWAIETLAWDWLFWNPMKALPIETASDAGSWLMKRIGPLGSANRTMLRNLRMAFPENTEKDIAAIARGAWENLGRVAGEMPHLHRIQPHHPEGRIEVDGGQYLDQINAGGKPAVFIAGHFANWETIASAVCNWPVNSQVTYRAANNPYIDRRISKARQAYGIQVLTPKGAGTRELMRALSSGQSVGLMNDQKFNQGIPVPFFGHEAMTAPGPTRLAMKYGAPLILVTSRRIGRSRYRVTVHEPFMPESGSDEQAAIYATVLKINRMLEACIREAPEQWFWMHNRWPKEAWKKAGVM